MAERSFEKEMQSLRLGEGAEFRGEGILAVTKALLQSGVAYVGGYQGAPISHLMDVLAEGEDILRELGVHFEASASEATAAAMLAASINYPLRGAVTWKSTVGTNVASDALANLASSGVRGGALIILGEDYGEGASIMQERTHAFAMKSQIWLLDPRPHLPEIVRAVEQGFELSEASNSPVMLMLRIRACHVYGRFIAKNNRRPAFSASDALAAPSRDYGRIILPPSTYAQEREKIQERFPAAARFVAEHKMNDVIEGEVGEVGIVLQGGLYNSVLRALELLDCADAFGSSKLPLYVLNVTYPLIPEEWVTFCSGKRAVLVVEEGQPEFIEQAASQILRKNDVSARLLGKDVLPMHGEYTVDALRKGLEEFISHWVPQLRATRHFTPSRAMTEAPLVAAGRLAALVPARPSGLCTGCPERPLFSAMKLLQRETGPLHISADIGCHSFATLPPFNMGNSIMGYGLGAAGASALGTGGGKRAMAVMGDGGFWHNGLTDPHLQHAGNAEGAARGAEHGIPRAQGDRCRGRVRTQPTTPRAAADEKSHTAGQARGARALRRRPRYLHRRSLVHPAFGLPVFDRKAESRSIAHRSGCSHRQQLRGLRSVWGSGPRGGTLSVILSRGARVQPVALGSPAGQGARRRHRRTSTAK
jgi:indolepyruvate ferredoxin oxidoreductase, alpha subunit